MIYSNKFWKNKKVFVTGHSGFKGSWLVALLLRHGAMICGYATNDQNRNSIFALNKEQFEKDIQNIYGDILDYHNLEKAITTFKPDIIFHLAAQALVIDGYKHPLKTWDINLMGTNNLLSACGKLANKCAVIVITTDKVYKNDETGKLFKENDPLGGTDPYSASKACVEFACLSWYSSFFNRSLLEDNQISLTTARAGNVIGGGDWSENRLIPDCIRSINNENTLHLRNPKATRPWQHVLDCLYGYLLLAQYKYCTPSQNEFDSFNFGPPESSQRSVKDVVQEVQTYLTNLRFSVARNETRMHEAGLLQLDINKASHTLAWKNQWDFKRAIKETVDWYLRENQGLSTYDITLEQVDLYLEEATYLGATIEA